MSFMRRNSDFLCQITKDNLRWKGAGDAPQKCATVARGRTRATEVGQPWWREGSYSREGTSEELAYIYWPRTTFNLSKAPQLRRGRASIQTQSLTYSPALNRPVGILDVLGESENCWQKFAFRILMPSGSLPGPFCMDVQVCISQIISVTATPTQKLHHRLTANCVPWPCHFYPSTFTSETSKRLRGKGLFTKAIGCREKSRLACKRHLSPLTSHGNDFYPVSCSPGSTHSWYIKWRCTLDSGKRQDR